MYALARYYFFFSPNIVVDSLRERPSLFVRYELALNINVATVTLLQPYTYIIYSRNIYIYLCIHIYLCFSLYIYIYIYIYNIFYARVGTRDFVLRMPRVVTREIRPSQAIFVMFGYATRNTLWPAYVTSRCVYAIRDRRRICEEREREKRREGMSAKM